MLNLQLVALRQTDDSKTISPRSFKVCVGGRHKNEPFSDTVGLNSTTQSRLFFLKTLRKEAFENILGKKENAGTCNQHFLLFPMFSILSKKIQVFKSHIYFVSSAKAFDLDQFNPFPNNEF